MARAMRAVKRSANAKSEIKVSVTVFRIPGVEGGALRVVGDDGDRLCVLVAKYSDPARRNRELGIAFARQRDLLVGDHGEAVSARMPILPLDLDSHDLSALAMKEARAPQDFTAPA